MSSFDYIASQHMVSYLSYALITRFTETCRELQADILDSGALCQPGPGGLRELRSTAGQDNSVSSKAAHALLDWISRCVQTLPALSKISLSPINILLDCHLT